MLACKGIFATPSIGICTRMVASEVNTRRIFAHKNPRMPIIAQKNYKSKWGYF